MRKTPVTLGVLAIVFGSVVALYDGARLALTSVSGAFNQTFGAMLANAPRKPGDPDPALMMAKAEALQKQLAPVTMPLLAAMVLFSVALIVIGVGLYQRRRWARSAALGWSVLGLLYLAVDLIVQKSVILPRSQAFLRDLVAGTPDANKMGPMMQTLGATQSGVIVLVSIGLAVFPVLLLILIGRRSAAADFVD